ncbi:MAG: hypothetical protein RL021_1493 [Bacteroidota bacterium]|jgi:hypothetical protein
MKKLVLVLFTGLLLSTGTQAQMASGSICPDFTGVDLNGNTWNLYSLLDSGKTVFVDVSATWCGPCWSFHNTGRLEALYNTYGPPGTNELMVFFIEGDGTTTLADLQGTGTNTQGDWITGTPYPIIDDASIGNLLQINYFPTIYMICPDRIIKEVGQLASTAAFYTQKTTNCFSATDVNDAGITNSMQVLNGVLASCDPVDINYRLCNYGTAPLTSATIDLSMNGTSITSYNWTGNLNTYESVDLAFTAVTAPNYGTNTATIATSNPNGYTDNVTGNDSKTQSVTRFGPSGGSFTAQTFAVATFPPANWIQVTSPTASGTVWLRSTAGNGGAGSAKANFWSASNGDQDALQLPQLDLTLVAIPMLTFDIAHARYQTSNDNLKVKVSTDCGATWTTVYNKTGAALATTTASTTAFTPSTAAQWRKDTVNLTAYAGNQNVFVRFEANSNYGNNAYIDNVNIATNTTGIGQIVQELDFDLYPNPAADRASIEFMVEGKQDVALVVYNSIGEVVYSRNENGMSAGEYTFEIPTSGFSSGMYLISVQSGQASSSKRLLVK